MAVAMAVAMAMAMAMDTLDRASEIDPYRSSWLWRSPESSNTTRIWRALGLGPRTALDGSSETDFSNFSGLLKRPVPDVTLY